MNKTKIINLLGNFRYLRENNPSLRTPLIVSNYHVISNNQLPHIKHIYNYKNIFEFENDLNFYLKYFKKINIEDIVLNLDQDRNIYNSFFLTFDDGCIEALTVIAPILKKYDIKAAFFINPAFIDNKDMFYRHKASVLIEEISTGSVRQSQLEKIIQLLNRNEIINGPIEFRLRNIKYHEKFLLDQIGEIMDYSFSDYLTKNPPYLNSYHIDQLIEEGHYIGGHSIDHPLFADITLTEQIRQTIESTNYIVKRFNLNYKIFSIPHIDVNINKSYFDRILNIEKFDLIFGNSNLRKEKDFNRVIHRITGENPDHDIYDFINTHLIYEKFERFLGRNLIVRK